VTEVAHTLPIQILNAPGLQDHVCECYGSVKAHYEKLLGTFFRK
jgi:hypothetical protein